MAALEIVDMIPVRKRKSLGIYQRCTRTKRIKCDRFSWFARNFMKSHIELENDPERMRHAIGSSRHSCRRRDQPIRRKYPAIAPVVPRPPK